MGSSHRLIMPFSTPLYTTMGTNWSPAAVMTSTTVVCFVLLIVVQMRMVFVPRISSVFGDASKNILASGPY